MTYSNLIAEQVTPTGAPPGSTYNKNMRGGKDEKRQMNDHYRTVLMKESILDRYQQPLWGRTGQRDE